MSCQQLCCCFVLLGLLRHHPSTFLETSVVRGLAFKGQTCTCRRPKFVGDTHIFQKVCDIYQKVRGVPGVRSGPRPDACMTDLT